MADLVSRKPKPHGHDESPALAQKTIALEYKPVPEEEQPALDETAVDRSAESGSEAQVEASLLEPDAGSTDTETAAPVAVETPAALVDIQEPTNISAPHQLEDKSASPTRIPAVETSLKTSPTRRKKVDAIVKPVVSADPTGQVAPAVVTAPKSFMDEMADLDAEVDALRRQLAKKLITQNAQLRKMLARFEVR
ncbi:hypothetical protein [Rhizobium sp. WYJ-E13]|uniref:hypothetical protein n=1 Tax=Rhizobium sp. WYJ-E13 TaxID=2849093 RepID=UPI001C1E9DB1|nr:hypothetical protein [Rhizobium sp. WYJ-E13]QWW72631.1 hypothetical protein KQ933_31650 [Rhizobium sp. WYJ-E13]